MNAIARTNECACRCAGVLALYLVFHLHLHLELQSNFFDLLYCNKIKMRPPYFRMRKVKPANILFYGMLILFTALQPFEQFFISNREHHSGLTDFNRLQFSTSYAYMAIIYHLVVPNIQSLQTKNHSIR